MLIGSNRRYRGMRQSWPIEADGGGHVADRVRGMGLTVRGVVPQGIAREGVRH